MRAARFVAQLGFVPAPEVFAAMREMAATIEIVSAERVRDELVKLLLAPHPRAGLELLVRQRAGDPRAPRAAGAAARDRRAPPPQGRLRALADRAGAGDRPGGPRRRPAESVPGPDLVLRLAALLHDIGKPATRRFEAGGGVSFHHHEVVGAKLVARRLRALRFDKETTKAVARLVELHLRFHGYGEGQWTDSAVRRYVTDAGPLLPRLHRLTRADCTTRNVRKARRLAATYDDLEARIDALLEQEELKAVRPELDGNEIARGARHPARPGARAGLQAPAGGADRRGADRPGGRPRAAARLVGRAAGVPRRAARCGWGDAVAFLAGGDRLPG